MGCEHFAPKTQTLTSFSYKHLQKDFMNFNNLICNLKTTLNQSKNSKQTVEISFYFYQHGGRTKPPP
jgi:hypothetical protein